MLTAPKEVEVTHKVVRVDTETGEKLFSTIPAIVKRESDKTIVTWEATNLRTFDAYRFDW
jgi:hypothetical protein